MRRQQHPNRALAAAIFAVLFFILAYTFSQLYGNELADQVNTTVARIFGTTASRVVAVTAPFVIPLGLAAMCLWVAAEVGKWQVRHGEFAEDPSSPALSLKPVHATDVAIYLLMDSAWGWRMRQRLSLRRVVKDHVAREMTRAGREYRVRYLGTPAHSQATVEIERTYWQYAAFDDDKLWDRRNKTYTKIVGPWAYQPPAGYQHVAAPEVDVFRAWPTAGVFLRTSVTIRLWLRAWRAGWPKWLREQPVTTDDDADQDQEIVDYKWLSPIEARRELVPSALVTEWMRARTTLLEKDVALDEAKAALGEITAQTPVEEAARRSRVVEATNIAVTAANWEHQDAYGKVRDYMQKRLQSGEFVARGFLTPHIGGELERMIPASEWRIMTLFIEEARAAGKNIEYVGVQIAKAV